MLTPKGKLLRDSAFKTKDNIEIDVNDYIVEVEAKDTFIDCRVKKAGARSTWYTVILPVEEIQGSRFGTCTCDANT